MSDIFDVAQVWLGTGVNVVPSMANGTKRPLFNWQRFQRDTVTEKQIKFWLDSNPGVGIGLICGAVSGNLEMLELEGRANTTESMARIFEACKLNGSDPILDRLMESYYEQTPSGGVHFFYRITDHEVPGNTKVARRPATVEELEQNPKDKIKVLAETRGEGGFVIVAPSGGSVHPSGDPWVALSEPGVLVHLTWEERNLLIEAFAEALDEMPAPRPDPRPESMLQYVEFDHTGDLRPGDDYNQRATWDEILEPLGWNRLPRHGDRNEVLWVRPGKDPRDGHSASTGYANDEDRLYVWSSSTEFDTEVPYTKFAAYALLNHGGDYAAASRELRRLGFGSSRLPASVSTTTGTMETAADVTGVLVPQTTAVSNELPHPSAGLQVTEVLKGRLPHKDGYPDLAWWRGEFYRWTGTHWKPRAESAVTGWIYQQLGSSTYVDGRGTVKQWPTSKNTAISLTHTLGIGWLQRDPDEDEDSTGLIHCENGALNPRTLELLPHSPARFNLHALPYGYDPDAQCDAWLKFLDQVLPDDIQAQEFLQEWFGYVLSGRTDLQKMANLVGPKRSGKGTIGRVLTKLLGQQGTTSPTLEDLGRQFGIQGLIGKRLAIMSDVKWNLRAANAAVPELLAIIGEDGRSVPRKNLTNWDGQIGARFMAMSNDSPKFSDASGALAGRMIHVRFKVSFHGRENSNLSDELYKELPGILNWALEGLARLEGRGRFTEPESGAQIVAEVEENSAPVKTFVKDCAEVADGAEVPLDDAYRAYRSWCEEEGRDHVPSMSSFARDLRSAFSDQGVEMARVRRDGDVRDGTGRGRIRMVIGIRLQEWVKEDPKYNLKWLAGGYRPMGPRDV